MRARYPEYLAYGRERRTPSAGSKHPRNLELWVVGRGLERGETSMRNGDGEGVEGHRNSAVLGAASPPTPREGGKWAE